MNKILAYWRKKTPSERVELWYLALFGICVGVLAWDFYTDNLYQAIIIGYLIIFTMGCFIGSKIRRDAQKMEKKEDLE